jgi:hypothetical protein
MMKRYSIKHNTSTGLYHIMVDGKKPRWWKGRKGFATIRKLYTTRDRMTYFAVSDKPKGLLYIVDMYGDRLLKNMRKCDQLVKFAIGDFPGVLIIYKNAETPCSKYRILSIRDGRILYPLNVKSIPDNMKSFIFDIFKDDEDNLIFVVDDLPMSYDDALMVVRKRFGILSMSRYKHLRCLEMINRFYTITPSDKTKEPDHLFGKGRVSN